MSPRRSTRTDPRIMEMPAQRMAVVRGQGKPDKVFPALATALYGAVFTLKFFQKRKGLPVFEVGKLRARYPDAHLAPPERWTILLGLPVPEDTVSLPQKVGGAEVKLETWQYGTVAQILHIGPYDQETPAIERLQRFLADSGYEVAGIHEEEYLTRPDAREIKTIIRYPVRKAMGSPAPSVQTSDKG